MAKRLMFLILSLAVLVGMGLATTAAIAGDGVYGSMTFRWDGYRNALDQNSNTDDSYAFSFLRSRIGYKTEIGERGMFNLSVQNIHLLGGDHYGLAKSYFNGSNSNNSVDINEAYFGINDFLFRGFDAYAGRFALSYGRERMIGTEEWSFYGEHRFDGFKGHYAFEKGWFDLLCLKLYEDFANRYNTNTARWGDRDLRGVYAHFDAAEGMYVEPYILWLQDSVWSNPDFAVDVKNDNIFNIGALFDYTTDNGLHFYAEGVYQTGTFHDWTYNSSEDPVAADTDLSALGFYAGAFYEFDSIVKPFIGAEFNYASGTKNADTKDKTFYSPYGSFSSYMGIMNIVDWSNTASFRFSGGLTPVEGTDVKVDFYLFKLATAEESLQWKWNEWTDFPGGVSTDGVYDKNVGTEIDFFVDHKIADGVSANAGFSMFSFGDYFGASNTYDTVLYGWLGGQVHF